MLHIIHQLLIRWAVLGGLGTAGSVAAISYYAHLWDSHGWVSARARAWTVELALPESPTLPLAFDRYYAPVTKTIAPEFVPGLVSVIIPTYNRSHTILHAVDSVLAQTYSDIEVVVVDDGSTDNTEQLLRDYDPRVRYLRQTNAGVSAARNTGFRAARGEFIGLLDSDDEWLSWKAALQVAALKQFPDVGMVWTDMAAFDHRGATVADSYLHKMYSAYSRVAIDKVMHRRAVVGDLHVPETGGLDQRVVLAGDIFPYMLLGNLVHTSTVLLRRDRLGAIGGFDEGLRISGEDYEFHLKTCYAGPVGYIDVSSIRYRVGADDQLTARRYMLPVARNNLTTVRRWIKRAGPKLDVLAPGQIRSTLANAHGWLGAEEFEAGNYTEARRQLRAGFTFGGVSARSLAMYAAAHAPPVTRIYRRWNDSRTRPTQTV